ncbi:MAG: response regulator [Bacillota bacterium]|nr:response regulator [Bacillota bacterium]
MVSKIKIEQIEEEGKRIFLAEQMENTRRVIDSLMDFRVSENKDRLKEIKRFFHTIKGTAGVLKYNDLAKIAERFDSFLNAYSSPADFSHKLYSTILEGISLVRYEISALYYAKFNFVGNDEDEIILDEECSKIEVDCCNLDYIYTIDCKRILIVDDDKSILNILEKALKIEGYDICCIENPLNVMETVKSFRPDLIILDVVMPVMNGFQVLDGLRRANVDTQVIFLTSEGGMDNKISAFKNGATDYILKPFDLKELIVRVERSMKETFSNRNRTMIDEYTGSFTYSVFNENFKVAKSRFMLNRENFCVALVDIDDFQKVSHEGANGTAIINQIYNKIKSNLRATDQIYRNEGDQFIILMANTDLNRGYSILELTRKAISADSSKSVNGSENLTFSIGMTEFNDDKENINDILGFCREALLKSKQSGKNKISAHKKQGYAEKSLDNKKRTKRKALIIDDSMSIVYMAKNHLESLKFEVDYANNGQQGIIKSILMKPDIVILDLMLPDIDGFEVLNKVKNDPNLNNAEFIIITSYSKKEYIDRCRSMGVNEILVKPFSLHELEARIKRIFSKT